MPSHRTHRMIDRLFLGKEYPHVHRWMDRPCKWLGPKHRVLRHSFEEAFLKYGFSEEFLSACLHILADYGLSERRRRRRR